MTASKVCKKPGCPHPATYRGHCSTHAQLAERIRGSRQARGYDQMHQQLRRNWAPRVATGTVPCARCHQPIAAGAPWQLGHDDHDRSRWTGPEHPLCNLSAGGRAAHGLPPR